MMRAVMVWPRVIVEVWAIRRRSSSWDLNRRCISSRDVAFPIPHSLEQFGALYRYRDLVSERLERISGRVRSTERSNGSRRFKMPTLVSFWDTRGIVACWWRSGCRWQCLFKPEGIR